MRMEAAHDDLSTALNRRDGSSGLWVVECPTASALRLVSERDESEEASPGCE